MYFQDYFESYTPGPVTPTGMTTPGGSPPSTILASGFGIDGSQCWVGGFAWRDESTFVDNITIFHALKRTSKGNSDTNNFIQLWNTTNPFNLGNPPGRALFHVNTEFDSTLSFYVGNVTDFDHLIGNSGKPTTGADPFVMEQNTWFMLQCDLQFGTIAAGTSTNHNLTLDATISVNGTKIIHNNMVDTSFLVESLPTALPAVNVPLWNLTGYQFDSMTYEAITTLNDWPQIDVNRQARFSQAVVEAQELIDNSDPRASQLVVEVEKLPDNSFARASQLVIELMIKRITTGNWRVYEA